METNVRKDSLIKHFKIEESDLKIYKNKIIFVTVKGLSLVYYTNTESFMESLKSFKENFVITYEFSKVNGLVDETKQFKRVIKVKLPKLPKK